MRRYYWLIPMVLIFGALVVILLLSSTNGMYIPGYPPRSFPLLFSPKFHLSLYNLGGYPDYRIPPEKTLIAVLKLLLIPPLPLIHLWLLAQVYRHAYQPGERFKPYKLAGFITIPITAIETIGIEIWIWINNHTPKSAFQARDGELFVLWVIISIITISWAVGGAIYICRERGFSPEFQRSMIRSTIEVSLIVPFGMVGGVLFWLVAMPTILGFIVYRFATEQHLAHHNTRLPAPIMDQLILDQVAVTFPIVLIFAVSGFGTLSFLFIRIFNGNEITLGGLITLLLAAGIGGCIAGWWPVRSIGRFSSVYHKKKSDNDQDLFPHPGWIFTMIGYTGLWLILSVGAWYAMNWLVHWWV